MEIRPASPEVYNRFVGPIEADRLLWSDDHRTTALMREIGALVISAGLQDVLCLRLLHRHHQMDADSMMLEFEGRAAGGRALITAVTPRAGASGFLPNVLSITDLGLASAEYSRISVFSTPHRVAAVLAEGTLLEAIRRLIIDAGLQSVLAIGFRNKRFFDAGGPDAMMVEVTDEANGQSIITWEPGDDLDTVIQTLWGFAAASGAENGNGGGTGSGTGTGTGTGGGTGTGTGEGDEENGESGGVGSGTPVIQCDVRCFVGCREVDGVHQKTGHEEHHLGLPKPRPPASGTPQL